MMLDNLAQAQAILATQPFSVFLGAELTRFDPQHVELSVPFRPEFQQQFGFAHGGVLSYLADNGITFAGGAVLGPDVITSEYKINYLKPALGERLIARASVIGASSRQAVCRCDVFAVKDGQEYLCSTAQGTIVRRGGEGA
jgi:uncharacterized protein (TIGR00369 family)